MTTNATVGDHKWADSLRAIRQPPTTYRQYTVVNTDCEGIGTLSLTKEQDDLFREHGRIQFHTAPNPGTSYVGSLQVVEVTVSRVTFMRRRLSADTFVAQHVDGPIHYLGSHHYDEVDYDEGDADKAKSGDQQ